MVSVPMLVVGWINVEYRLTNEDLNQLKQAYDRGATEYWLYYDQLVKERFDGNRDSLADEIFHRLTGRSIFDKRQRFK